MERQAALLFFGLYAVRYCVLKLFFFKKVTAHYWRKAVFKLIILSFANVDNKNYVDVISNSLPSRR